jgi:hypothetical protein
MSKAIIATVLKEFDKKNYISIEEHKKIIAEEYISKKDSDNKIAQKLQIISIQDYQLKVLKLKIQSLQVKMQDLKNHILIKIRGIKNV